MILDDPDLRAEFSSAKRCESCGSATPWGADPHHLFSKGAGQIDHRWNLISLCRLCHSAYHAGSTPSRAYLLELVAKRELTSPEAIRELVQRLRRMPREAVLCRCGGTGIWQWETPHLPPLIAGCALCEGNGAVMPDGSPIPAHLIRENADAERAAAGQSEAAPDDHGGDEQGAGGDDVPSASFEARSAGRDAPDLEAPQNRPDDGVSF